MAGTVAEPLMRGNLGGSGGLMKPVMIGSAITAAAGALMKMRSKQLAAPKLVLRGFLKRQLQIDLLIGSSLVATVGALMEHYYVQPRRQAYIDFYKTYDAEKEYVEMREKGLFQGARPQGNLEC